jgi:ribose/xylose/arabinose/galactoside ABC-type transport system permease subunit
MQILWGRIMLSTVIVAVMANMLFILFLAALAPENQESAFDFANTHRLWLEPLLGILFTFLLAFWNGRLIYKYQVRNGFTLGIFVVAVDILLGIFGEEQFNWVFIPANILVILSGAIGGWCSKKTDPRNS